MHNVSLSDLIHALRRLKSWIDLQPGRLYDPRGGDLRDSRSYAGVSALIEAVSVQGGQCLTCPSEIRGVKAVLVPAEEPKQGAFNARDFIERLRPILRESGAQVLNHQPCCIPEALHVDAAVAQSAASADKVCSGTDGGDLAFVRHQGLPPVKAAHAIETGIRSWQPAFQYLNVCHTQDGTTVLSVCDGPGAVAVFEMDSATRDHLVQLLRGDVGEKQAAAQEAA